PPLQFDRIDPAVLSKHPVAPPLAYPAAQETAPAVPRARIPERSRAPRPGGHLAASANRSLRSPPRAQAPRALSQSSGPGHAHQRALFGIGLVVEQCGGALAWRRLGAGSAGLPAQRAARFALALGDQE